MARMDRSASMSCTVRKIDNGWIKSTSRMGESGEYNLTETFHETRPHLPSDEVSALRKAAGPRKPRST